MSTRRLSAIVAAVSLAATAGCGTSGEPPTSHMRGDSGPNRVKDDEGPWKEAASTLPAYPRDKDLIQFEPTGRTTNRFYVDGSSLTVGKDKVIRFALVIRSPEGANTVTYSGVKCKPWEWKDYAFGRDGEQRWESNPDSQWRGIEDKAINNYQYTLSREYFCTYGVFSSGPMGDAKMLVRNLKYPKPVDNRVPARYN
jgi:hypothetical protein